jgi:hypothetical protein
MEAAIKPQEYVSQKETKKTNNSSFWSQVEFSRFGIISMLVIIIGCVGGFAASFGAHGDLLKLSMVAFPTIITLAMVLAVAPMKTILYLSGLCLLLDLLIFTF